VSLSISLARWSAFSPERRRQDTMIKMLPDTSAHGRHGRVANIDVLENRSTSAAASVLPETNRF